ncbi:GH25 family lysozyme [Fodinicola feengrottensis]|uniref:GH25 family lysozyme n=1 Tax=Fodinicola feengrottensis TaxID=435914 RepID=UPI0013D1F7DF|nr:GH25 family lysozyme [Fodinicola feengrottensis]
MSNNNPPVNWSSVKASGQQFAYVKATENLNFIDGTFGANYVGAYNAGVPRGAYHFAIPDASTGTAQADYFLAHGGRWSRDGLTLPGAVDLESRSGHATCYGKSQAQMVVQWIRDFTTEYKAVTTRDAVIYTSKGWWDPCTGGSNAFAATNPLWAASWGGSSPTMPSGFGVYTFWQWTSTGSVPGTSGNTDLDVFNGDSAGLGRMINGG